jgi:ribonuclease BN (tRNA processing enzyme)
LIAAWVQLNAFANTGLQFKDLKAMFITHLHTDHIVDYYSFFASGGFQAPPGRAPVLVYGPGPAGGLPPDEVGNPNPATIDPPPADPAPGLAANTAALHQAFAYTNNIFIRDFGTDDIEDLVKVTEIAVPPGSRYLNRSPKMDPFPVMSDDNVAVTATLVSHYNVYPAFGFRFDLKKAGKSVTFSGDTTKSDNLITLAQGTDILVHESHFSLDDAFHHNIFPPNYLPASHTSAEQVGEVGAAKTSSALIAARVDAPVGRTRYIRAAGPPPTTHSRALSASAVRNTRQSPGIRKLKNFVARLIHSTSVTSAARSQSKK